MLGAVFSFSVFFLFEGGKRRREEGMVLVY